MKTPFFLVWVGIAVLVCGEALEGAPDSPKPAPGQWSITDFKRSCTSNSCHYQFTVSEGIPSRQALCDFAVPADGDGPEGDQNDTRPDHRAFRDVDCRLGENVYKLSSEHALGDSPAMAISVVSEARQLFAVFAYTVDDFGTGRAEVSISNRQGVARPLEKGLQGHSPEATIHLTLESIPEGQVQILLMERGWCHGELRTVPLTWEAADMLIGDLTQR
jgi:hypothetical protein